jgi:hypothetical protein
VGVLADGLVAIGGEGNSFGDVLALEAGWSVVPRKQSQPLGALMRRLSVVVVVVVFSLFGLGAASAVADTHVELHASLSGSKAFPHAHGSSTFERKGGVRDVDVTVSGIARLSGKRVTVFVAGKKVGRVLVSPGGTAHRDFSTADGESFPSLRRAPGSELPLPGASWLPPVPITGTAIARTRPQGGLAACALGSDEC